MRLLPFSFFLAAIPSLRARDCSKNEKEALNYLFLLIPLLNVIIPFFWKSFAFVWSADTLAFFGMYAWKVYWSYMLLVLVLKYPSPPFNFTLDAPIIPLVFFLILNRWVGYRDWTRHWRMFFIRIIRSVSCMILLLLLIRKYLYWGKVTHILPQ